MDSSQSKDRIALVLLHGIGEPRPMATLRGFVKGVFGEHGRSKPDRLSELFEVRRLDIQTPSAAVHCYELYWAHHMESSALQHILKWLVRLLRTPSNQLRRMSGHLGKNIYVQVRAAVVLITLALGAVVIVGAWAIGTSDWFGAGAGAVLLSVAIAAAGLVWRVINYQLINVVGDAARYLDSAPSNVGVRQAIRAECVRFLTQLSESGDPDYSRIIVIGHSLGSVIAYDALRLLWAKRDVHVAVSAATASGVGLLEPVHSGRSSVDGEPSPRRVLFREARARQSPAWKISDFVSVGSPLTHAPLLLAESCAEFEQMKQQRELPTSPPVRDAKTGYCGWIEGSDFKLHHAAAFAVVEWTNMYYPTDPIGGPLQRVFGPGICDIELTDAPKCRWSDHVRYWSVGKNAGRTNFCREVVRVLDNERAAT